LFLFLCFYFHHVHTFEFNSSKMTPKLSHLRVNSNWSRTIAFFSIKLSITQVFSEKVGRGRKDWWPEMKRISIRQKCLSSYSRRSKTNKTLSHQRRRKQNENKRNKNKEAEERRERQQQNNRTTEQQRKETTATTNRNVSELFTCGAPKVWGRKSGLCWCTPATQDELRFSFAAAFRALAHQ